MQESAGSREESDRRKKGKGGTGFPGDFLIKEIKFFATNMRI